MTGTLNAPKPNSDPCFFCGQNTEHHHGIHGLSEINLCSRCKQAFIVCHYLTDPKRHMVLGFQCANCNFTCDVPGYIEFDKDALEWRLRVDQQHRYCQNCGMSTRAAYSQSAMEVLCDT